MPAVICAVALVAVLATVMAFRGPAGQQFVGSWRVPDPVTGGIWTVRISRTSDGFALQVPMPNVAPVPYRFKGGKLVPAPGYESGSVLSLVGDKLVMTPPDTPAATPKPKATHAAAPIITAQPTTTPQPTSTGSRTRAPSKTTRSPRASTRCRPPCSRGPPITRTSTRRPTWSSRAARSPPTSQSVQTWPTNPVTGQPMKPGTGAGDYTYEQVDAGRGFKLTGYGVDATPLITVP